MRSFPIQRYQKLLGEKQQKMKKRKEMERERDWLPNLSAFII